MLQAALSHGRQLASEATASPDAIRVLTSADMRRAALEGKVGALFTVEEGAVIEDNLANLSLLYDVGMRMMTLTWNYRNSLGAPNATMEDYAREGAAALTRLDDNPLTDLGREAVREMNRLGVLVDVSHLSDGGFWDALAVSASPVVASHSNARAVRNVGRNLSDAMLAALAERGGVAGLNLTPDFLCSGEEDVLDYAIRHVLHVWQIAGEDVLALGSDFDGMTPRAPLTDCSSVPLLYDALCARIPPRVVDKMMWGNFLRVFTSVCG